MKIIPMVKSVVTVSSVRVRRPVLCWTIACVCVRVCACVCACLCLLLQYCDARDSSLCVGIGLRAWWCVPEVCERPHGWLVGTFAAECVCLPCLSVLMRLPVPVACKLCLAGCGCECLWK